MGLTCEHCNAAVDVPMHHGATLRCGCGKTTQPVALGGVCDVNVPSRPGTVMELSNVCSLMETMVKYKALRVKAGDLEVELSPDAFAPHWPAQSSSLGYVEEKTCRCGHSVEVAHNEHGLCLEGCEPDACAEKAAA